METSTSKSKQTLISKGKRDVIVVCVLLFFALASPQAKTTLYSLPFGGDELQSYKIEIAETELRVRLFPRSSREHYQLGVLYIENIHKYGDKYSNIANAVNEFEKSIECDPRFGDSYFRLGDIYLQYLDKPASAIPLFTQSVERGFEVRDSYARLGVAYERVGNFSLSQKHWEQYEILLKR